MAKQLALGIEIGASLSGGFSAAIGGAKQKLTTLGAEIKALGAQRGLIERVEKDRAALEQSRGQLAATNRTLAQLKTALASGPPTAQAAKAMADARAKADHLSAAIDRQRRALRTGEQALAKTGMKVGDLAGQYAKLGGALDATRTKHDRLNRTMSRKDAAAASLGDLRNKVIGLGAAAYGAGKIIGEAMDFESAMADVRKVVNFPEPDGLVKMGATLKDMSRRIPISAAGLAQIAAAGGQLGISAKDLPGFTETVAKMATAFDMLPDEAGDAMAKLSNVYQIPIAGMGALGDAINHLSDNTAAKAKDIVPVLARVGGTARQFGLSAVQTAALGDAFIALGKPPEVAATAINAMLTKLQTATRQGGKFKGALQDIGMSAEQMEAAIAEDGQGALEKFLESVAGIDKQERAGLLSDLFGMEYADDISLLTGSLDQYRKALKLVGDQSAYAGSMGREFANRSATTANQMQLAKNAVSVLAINIGSTLLPAINAVLRPVAALAGWLGDLAERFPWVSRLVGGVAVGLGVFVAVMGAAAAATWLWNAALLANPIGIVVAAVGGAAALIITFWDPVKSFFSGFWAQWSADAITFWDGLKAGAATAAGALMAAWTGVKDFFGELWGWLKGLFAEGVAFLAKVWEASPLGLLFAAGQKLAAIGGKAIGGVFGGDTDDARTSTDQHGPRSLVAGPGIGAAMVQDSPGGISSPAGAGHAGGAAIGPKPAAPGAQVDARVTAPITINAAPGQDPKAIAVEVDRQLHRREADAAARARGALYD